MYMHYETEFLLVLCNSSKNYNILKYVYDSLSFVNGINFYESMGLCGLQNSTLVNYILKGNFVNYTLKMRVIKMTCVSHDRCCDGGQKWQNTKWKKK